MGKLKAKTAKPRRHSSAARDLTARKSGVKAGAGQASYLLPYIEQDNMVRRGSGRIGSVAVDPSDPS